VLRGNIQFKPNVSLSFLACAEVPLAIESLVDVTRLAEISGRQTLGGCGFLGW
jgi:hypothetical protein